MTIATLQAIANVGGLILAGGGAYFAYVLGLNAPAPWCDRSDADVPLPCDCGKWRWW